ncbi:pyridoxamine 5'-phosphate oxidase family protein [Formosa haliotis]|uniref:pyridoxamine 5'-phosphate oxidase family protein n=1 Tax=Formosa haliotis TaxID=1555194 RepID=UPI0008266275|nr:pyridoxamine 5'-phosphate oxidase family protein [Formosa haliotis]
MGKKTNHISKRIQSFISKQNMFFVGTAADEGRVNISPKGMDSFRVINKNKIIWLNLTGSGNETAAHLLKHNRMTIMFCAFEGNPLILRLYGTAKIFHPRDSEFNTYISHFPTTVGARQIIEMDVDLVQTSCGFAVPLMEYKADRDTLVEWSEEKGQKGIEEYWIEKNSESIDGFETKITNN